VNFGIHLPQFGRAAVPGAIERAARHAESLGYADVWVSDHLIVPAGQTFPHPYLYEPLLSLAFAAAASSTIGIGTSVLVAPQYTSPLALANSLASLDNLSAGRLIVGLGIGWSEAEYRALHASYSQRGARLDEIVDLLRAVFHDDPTSHKGTYYGFEDVRVLPKPVHEVPIWLGGTSDPAIERALRTGDGYHGMGVEPEQAKALVERIRARRPEESFTISLRVGWDAASVPVEEIRTQRDAYEAAGIQHIHVAPVRGDLDAWLLGMETIAGALDLTPP
jgi:probable F420-dependent oxidoreductase